MPLLLLAGVVLVGIGVLLAVLGRQQKAVRGHNPNAAATVFNPPWTIVSAGTMARIGPLVDQITATVDRIAQLHASLDSLVLAGASPSPAADVYAGFGAKLSEVARDHLPQSGAAANRFTSLVGAVVHEMSNGPDRHREALDATARQMRALHLRRSDLVPGWVEPYETALERYERDGRSERERPSGNCSVGSRRCAKCSPRTSNIYSGRPRQIWHLTSSPASYAPRFSATERRWTLWYWPGARQSGYDSAGSTSTCPSGRRSDRGLRGRDHARHAGLAPTRARRLGLPRRPGMGTIGPAR